MNEPSLRERYRATRATTGALAARLAPDDQLAQSMDDASPTKWHLAHTTWFFERMVLAARPGYAPVHPRYDFLFNSYYEAVGARQPRPRRALITRPTLDEVRAYRAEIDRRVLAIIDDLDAAGATVVRLGCEHEQQHQELILTDAKHALFHSPLRPAYASVVAAATVSTPRALAFVAGPDGLVEIGHAGPGFAFDNEGPRHRVWLEPFELADRCVTNREWDAFIAAGGYRDPRYWLSDGWATVQREGWTAPLYWDDQDGAAAEFTLAGTVPRDPDAPVCHVSFYEADAYARWHAAHVDDGVRLPSESEWEAVAQHHAQTGNFLERGRFHPAAPAAGETQLFGDVWEWTASPYVGYPRFRPLPGALGEYNGKFMCNQLVLRGGSCLSPADHLRPTYRNFFAPATRWQMAGLRLARWR